jgi:hypothetical protein
MTLFGISLGDLWPILVIVVWFALNRWLLPKLGVPT